jgi:adenine/guanine phosphoribosyltransferase-like PRPP-binding protein
METRQFTSKSMYLYEVIQFDPHKWDAWISEHANNIKRDWPNAKCLVGCGLSGALVVPSLARALGLPFAIIRKDGDSEHANVRVEGCISDDYLLVDDLVASGKTLAFMIERYRGATWTPNLLGAYLYYCGGTSMHKYEVELRTSLAK